MKRVLWACNTLLHNWVKKGHFKGLTSEGAQPHRRAWSEINGHARKHAFCPQHKVGHREGCWHSFNSVKYMVLLSNASLHLHSSCWPGPTATIDNSNHQQQQPSHTSRDSRAKLSELFALLNILAVSLCNSERFLFFPHSHKLTKPHRLKFISGEPMLSRQSSHYSFLPGSNALNNQLD